MDLYEALLVKALHAVLHPDHEAFLRHVKRFYSKTFHVPLPQVDDLNEEEVLQAYYEEALDQMSEEDREELFDKLTETEEEREEREQTEKVAETKDDQFFENLNKEVLSGTVRGPPKEKPKKWAPKAKPKVAPVAATELAPPPPDIHMNFGASEGNLPEEWGNLDPLAPSPRK